MDVFEAIKGRRSIGKVKPDEVDRGLLEQMLEAAVWAPNHYLTEPWKFFVMTGEGRRRLGSAYSDIALGEMPDLSAEERTAQRAKLEARAYRAPAVIAVAASPSGNAAVAEELAAVHAAVQNMLLAAHALGLGAIWRTGEPAYHPLMRQAFGLEEREQMVGFIYVGHPDMPQPAGKRTQAPFKTVWID